MQYRFEWRGSRACPRRRQDSGCQCTLALQFRRTWLQGGGFQAGSQPLVRMPTWCSVCSRRSLAAKTRSTMFGAVRHMLKLTLHFGSRGRAPNLHRRLLQVPPACRGMQPLHCASPLPQNCPQRAAARKRQGNFRIGAKQQTGSSDEQSRDLLAPQARVRMKDIVQLFKPIFASVALIYVAHCIICVLQCTRLCAAVCWTCTKPRTCRKQVTQNKQMNFTIELCAATAERRKRRELNIY